MKSSGPTVASLGLGLVVVLGCNLVSGPIVADPQVVEFCLAWCERRDECDRSQTIDCERIIVPACEREFAALRCPGGEEQLDACLASLGVQECEDVLNSIGTEECRDFCPGL